jgi:hypothetical protein
MREEGTVQRILLLFARVKNSSGLDPGRDKASMSRRAPANVMTPSPTGTSHVKAVSRLVIQAKEAG